VFRPSLAYRAVLLALGLVATGLLFKQLVDLLLLLAITVIIAVLIAAGADWLHRFRVPRALGGASRCCSAGRAGGAPGPRGTAVRGSGQRIREVLLYLALELLVSGFVRIRLTPAHRRRRRRGERFGETDWPNTEQAAIIPACSARFNYVMVRAGESAAKRLLPRTRLLNTYRNTRQAGRGAHSNRDGSM
jgi:hypothetical protein